MAVAFIHYIALTGIVRLIHEAVIEEGIFGIFEASGLDDHRRVGAEGAGVSSRVRIKVPWAGGPIRVLNRVRVRRFETAHSPSPVQWN